ncbi:MAG: TetR/AcrR family transcriptional regulator, partial [Myxococcales bacterium]|nr:TetR/AcrR family transcriptional regulator [Myxococcales bacterium]
MPLERSQIRIRDAAVELFAEKGSSEVSVTELAKAAGIARGTVYNNVEDPQNLFEEVAAELAAEMYRRILVSYAEVDDPAVRLAHGIRFYIRRAHEEPAWGRFITRFAFSEGSLREMWTGPPMQDVLLGIARGRYDFPQVQVPSV